MRSNLIMMKKPNFLFDLTHSIMDELKIVYENIYNDELEEELYVIVQKVCRYYFSNVIPRRSYKSTFEKPREILIN